MTIPQGEGHSPEKSARKGRVRLFVALVIGTVFSIVALKEIPRELKYLNTESAEATNGESSSKRPSLQKPIQNNSIQSLSGPSTPLIIRHDLKAVQTWLTLKPTDTWTVWPDHMSGVTISSESQEDIASWYGQTPTTTWGTFHIHITNEPGIEFDTLESAGIVTDTTTSVGGYSGMRRDYEDSSGRVDASVVVTLPTGVIYVFDTQVAGAAGASAATMRVELDRVLDSVSFVPDNTTLVSWTRSSIVSPSAVGNGFDVAHPTGWTVAGLITGGVSISSPASPPFSYGMLNINIAPASAADASRWDTEQRLPHYMLRHETRSTSPTGLTTPLSFIPTSAYLVRTGNGATWLVAVSNPASSFGSAGFWLYDQTLYRIVTDSVIAYVIPAYP